jgi:peptidoglycan/LPS O-acetylase OafA/YrhL
MERVPEIDGLRAVAAPSGNRQLHVLSPASFRYQNFREVFAHLLLSHWALNRILQVTGSLVVTVLLASLSWKYFESPILRRSALGPQGLDQHRSLHR